MNKTSVSLQHHAQYERIQHELHIESVLYDAIGRLNNSSTRHIAENELKKCIAELIEKDALTKAIKILLPSDFNKRDHATVRYHIIRSLSIISEFINKKVMTTSPLSMLVSAFLRSAASDPNASVREAVTDVLALITRALILHHSAVNSHHNIDPIELAVLNRITSLSCPQHNNGRIVECTTGGWEKESKHFLGQAVCLVGMIKAIRDSLKRQQVHLSSNKQKILTQSKYQTQIKTNQNCNPDGENGSSFKSCFSVPFHSIERPTGYPESLVESSDVIETLTLHLHHWLMVLPIHSNPHCHNRIITGIENLLLVLTYWIECWMSDEVAIRHSSLILNLLIGEDQPSLSDEIRLQRASLLLYQAIVQRLLTVPNIEDKEPSLLRTLDRLLRALKYVKVPPVRQGARELCATISSILYPSQVHLRKSGRCSERQRRCNMAEESDTQNEKQQQQPCSRKTKRRQNELRLEFLQSALQLESQGGLEVKAKDTTDGDTNDKILLDVVENTKIIKTPSNGIKREISNEEDKTYELSANEVKVELSLDTQPNKKIVAEENQSSAVLLGSSESADMDEISTTALHKKENPHNINDSEQTDQCSTEVESSEFIERLRSDEEVEIAELLLDINNDIFQSDDNEANYGVWCKNCQVLQREMQELKARVERMEEFFFSSRKNGTSINL